MKKSRLRNVLTAILLAAAMAFTQSQFILADDVVQDPISESSVISKEAAETTGETLFSTATTDVTVEKVWDDEELLDLPGYSRPESVSFEVTGTTDTGAQSETKTVTVTAMKWKTIVTLPSCDESGNEYTYNVTELPIEGYTLEEIDYSADIENTADVAPFYVTVKKIDSETEDPLAGAVFTLTSNGEILSTKTTGEDGTVVFKLEDVATYSIQETSAPEGYNLNSTPISLTTTENSERKMDLTCEQADNGVITVADTAIEGPDVPETGKGVITVNKVWDDSLIKASVPEYAKYYSRPNKITFTLIGAIDDYTVVKKSESITPMNIADGDEEDPVVFDNLPLADSEGNTITYSVAESITESDKMTTYKYSYSTLYSWNEEETVCTVTNTVGECTIEDISGTETEKHTKYYSVQKIWNCAANEIPESIDVTLSNGLDKRTVTLNSDNNWFDGEELPYEIVTIHHNDARGWKSGGEYYDTFGNPGDTAETADCGKFEATEIDCPKGMIPSYDYDSNGHYVKITNSSPSSSCGINISKVWDDMDNADGSRPDQVTGKVEVKAKETNPYSPDDDFGEWLHWDIAHRNTSYTTTSYPFTLSKDNNWKQFIALDSIEDCTLTITEDAVTDYTTAYNQQTITVGSAGGYTSADNQNAVNFTITNSHKPTYIKHPAELTVHKTSQLTGEALGGAVFTAVNTEDSSDSQTVTTEKETGNAVFTFEKAGTYTISEKNAPEGYDITFSDCTVTVTENMTSNDDNIPVYTYEISGDEIEDGILKVSDRKSRDKGTLNITKVWDDGNNAENLRPDSVTVTAASSDGQKYTEILNEQNKWTVSIPVYLVDKDYKPVTKWTVTEDDIPDGYSCDITDKGTVFAITNRCDYDKKDITVTKTWNDSNHDGDFEYTRPDINIIVEGWVAGSKVSSTERTITAEDKWTVTLSGMPEKHAGKLISYVIYEKTPDGYTSRKTGYTVTSHNTPNTGERYVNSTLTLNKVDADSKEGLSGAVFEITSEADSDSVSEVSSVTTVDGVAALLITKPGTYIIRETSAPEGYALDSTEYTVTAEYEGPTVTFENGTYIKNYRLVLKDTDNGVLTITDTKTSDDDDTPDSPAKPDSGNNGKEETADSPVAEESVDNSSKSIIEETVNNTDQAIPGELKDTGSKAVLGETKDIPQTGDHSRVALWVLLMLLGAGCTVLMKSRSR